MKIKIQWHETFFEKTFRKIYISGLSTLSRIITYTFSIWIYNYPSRWVEKTCQGWWIDSNTVGRSHRTRVTGQYFKVHNGQYIIIAEWRIIYIKKRQCIIFLKSTNLWWKRSYFNSGVCLFFTLNSKTGATSLSWF